MKSFDWICLSLFGSLILSALGLHHFAKEWELAALYIEDLPE